MGILESLKKMFGGSAEPSNQEEEKPEAAPEAAAETPAETPMSEDSGSGENPENAGQEERPVQ